MATTERALRAVPDIESTLPLRLPELSLSRQELIDQKYHSTGAGTVIAHLDDLGQVSILLATHMASDKTQQGVLSWPRETMQWNSAGDFEQVDRTIARCFYQELSVDARNIPLYADKDFLAIETDIVQKTSQGDEVKYRALIAVLWVKDADWLPDEIISREIESASFVPLFSILDRQVEFPYREQAREVIEDLYHEGFFERESLPTDEVFLDPNCFDKFIDFEDIRLQ